MMMAISAPFRSRRTKVANSAMRLTTVADPSRLICHTPGLSFRRFSTVSGTSLNTPKIIPRFKETEMPRLSRSLALAALLAAPGLVQARPVTFTTTLAQYGGRGAYLAIYVVDAQGAYVGTVSLSGGKSRYWRHLSDWARTGDSVLGQIDGVTGASVGPGQTLTVTVELADALLDAGYAVHVDAAAEDFRESPSEIVVPLTAAGANVTGRGFVHSFSYDM